MLGALNVHFEHINLRVPKLIHDASQVFAYSHESIARHSFGLPAACGHVIGIFRQPQLHHAILGSKCAWMNQKSDFLNIRCYP
jgi:hypothetical protein